MRIIMSICLKRTIGRLFSLFPSCTFLLLHLNLPTTFTLLSSLPSVPPSLAVFLPLPSVPPSLSSCHHFFLVLLLPLLFVPPSIKSCKSMFFTFLCSLPLYPFLLNRATVSSLVLSPPPSLRSFPFSAPFFFLCGFSLVPCYPMFIKEYAFRRCFRFVPFSCRLRSHPVLVSFPFCSGSVLLSFPLRSGFIPFAPFPIRSL